MELQSLAHSFQRLFHGSVCRHAALDRRAKSVISCSGLQQDDGDHPLFFHSLTSFKPARIYQMVWTEEVRIWRSRLMRGTVRDKAVPAMIRSGNSATRSRRTISMRSITVLSRGISTNSATGMGSARMRIER